MSSGRCGGTSHSGGSGPSCMRDRMFSTTSLPGAPAARASEHAADAEGDGAQDAHELPVAVRSPAKRLPDLPERFGQIPSLEGRAVTQRPRLVFQHPKVVPCVIDHPVAAELPPVFPDNLAVTDHYYPVGVCTYHRRPAYSRGVHTVAVPVIRHKRRSRYPGRCLPVAVKRGAHGHKLLLLLGETRGYRALPELGML